MEGSRMSNDSMIVCAWKLVRRLRLGTIAGFLLVMQACAAFALAAGGERGGVPEIDPGSATSALAILTGGFLLVTDRIRRK